MSVYNFRLDVDGNKNYACPVNDSDITNADKLIGVDGPDFTVIYLLERGDRLGGLRLDVEVMDKLAKWWIDLRRVCPFCHEPRMDVEIDEQPSFKSVETSWKCEHCGGEYSLLVIAGSVPWEDPIAGTRTADEDIHRRGG